MRHNCYNMDFSFVKSPINFNKYTERDILAYALGGNIVYTGHKRFFADCNQ